MEVLAAAKYRYVLNRQAHASVRRSGRRLGELSKSKKSLRLAATATKLSRTPESFGASATTIASW